MVLPILKVNNDNCEIQIVDYAYGSEPVASLVLDEDHLSTDIFYVLLKGFINQYIYGWDDGFESAFDGESIP